MNRSYGVEMKRTIQQNMLLEFLETKKKSTLYIKLLQTRVFITMQERKTSRNAIDEAFFELLMNTKHEA